MLECVPRQRWGCLAIPFHAAAGALVAGAAAKKTTGTRGLSVDCRHGICSFRRRSPAIASAECKAKSTSTTRTSKRVREVLEPGSTPGGTPTEADRRPRRQHMTRLARRSALLQGSFSAVALASIVIAVGLTPTAARAQITGASSNNSGSACQGTNNSDGFCGSSTSVLVNNGTTFQSRHAWNINTDVGAGSTRDTSGNNTIHNLSFSATAPGSYQLNITSNRVGMIQRNSDVAGCDGQAHTSGITGTTNVGLNSGTLNTASPADIGNGGGDNQIGYNQTNSPIGVIGPRLSNGIAQSHVLTFTWNGSVRSNSCEAAVRQGQQNGSTSSCGACEYTGIPGRTQSSDGHFVTVSFTSFCGDGVIDGTGEQCDAGANNGSATSCCTSTCQFRTAGSVCRSSAGV